MIKRTAIVAAFAVALSGLSAAPASAQCNTVSSLFGSCPPPSSSTPPPKQSSPPPQQSSPPPSSSQPQSAPQPQPAGEVPGAAERLLELVNRERAAAGLHPLALRGDVSDISRGHSADMARERRIWHNDAYFTASVRQRLGARGLGENVAMNTSVDNAHRALMDSPGHRSNILHRDFGVVGLSVVRDERGVVYVTQNFVIPEGGAAEPAPKCKAKGKGAKKCAKAKFKAAKVKAKKGARR